MSYAIPSQVHPPNRSQHHQSVQTKHARGVLHGEVRPENILVRPDQSVVVIDFEMSELMAPREALVSEMREVKHLLASFIHSSLGAYS